MRSARPLVRASPRVSQDELEDGSQAEVEWARINFPDLQDLLFPSESDSESEGESTDGTPEKQLQNKAKVEWETILNLKWQIFKNGRMDSTTDLRSLAELEQHWSQITPQEFVMTLYALGPEAKQKDYLKSLCVEVDPLMLPRKQQKHVHNITMLFSQTWATWTEQENESRPVFDAKRPGFVSNCGPWDHMFAAETKCCGIRKRELEVVHRFAYTTVTSLFISEDPRCQVYILKALADSGRSSLGTPMGRALMLNRWLGARWEVFFEKAVDVVYLCTFLWANVKIRHGYVPSGPIVVTLFAVSVWTVLTKIAEMTAALKLFQSLYVLSTSIVLMSIELFNAATVIVLLWDCFDKAGLKCVPPQCQLMSHLASLSLSIFFKWAHVISSLLALRMFGERVLPAAYTIFSPESVRFLIVIFLLITASFHAYCTFPIPGTVPEYQDNATTWEYLQSEMHKIQVDNGQLLLPQKTFNMMMSMFNLDLMGDFDLLSLEGMNELVRLNTTTLLHLMSRHPNATLIDGLVAASIVDPASDKGVHQGVSLLLMVLCLFVNVIVMNIYIGLLSSVYERYSSQRWELLAEYKTIHVLRAKLSNPVNLLSYFDCTRKAYSVVRKLWPFAPESGQRAIWFAFRDEEFPAEEVCEDDKTAVLSQLEDIRKDVRKLVERRP